MTSAPTPRKRSSAKAALRADPHAERTRLADAAAGHAPWKLFGPWLAERAWGTVREDYSPGGDAWSFLPYDEAGRTAYRWNEDGLAGLCDDQQRLCLSFAFWNGRDDHLKERAFGLANGEGNHGEDVKEQWWYVDATPTASYLRWRYHYPQQAFPYDDLRATNAARNKHEPEYELADTGVLDKGYWLLELTVAKASPTDIVFSLDITNNGPAEDTLHVLPTVWFRNTWTWRPGEAPPVVRADGAALVTEHVELGSYRLDARQAAGTDAPVPLVCENLTDSAGRWMDPDGPAYPKNGINDHVVRGAASVNPAGTGTKGALHHRVTVAPGATSTLTWTLTTAASGDAVATAIPDPAAVITQRAAEADAFHVSLLPPDVAADSPRAAVARQALAGLIWSECFYHYDVRRWLSGDPGQPPPPSSRLTGRNHDWWHLDNHDVLSMPDPWEYPWYAAWDLAFHTVSLAHVDPDFAKAQLLLLCREWYMAPDGQLPAYEWDYGDVNPPVHAWAALEVFHISGATDYAFLERVFHKLLINHTWWTNREDHLGNNIFEGGFLGLDNIGAFDRSHVPADAGQLLQADATAWMAMYTLDLLEMALTLARHDSTYEDIATKFFEHFSYIARAMGSLWDEQDGFFYDVLAAPNGTRTPLRVRSVAGLVCLAAQRVVSAETLAALPGFAARLTWFVTNMPPGTPEGVMMRADDGGWLLNAVPVDRLHRVLGAALDEDEFLSPNGLRSLSRIHATQQYSVQIGGQWTPPVDYEPAESTTGLFGGNSNWRGPVWMPINALIVSALRRSSAFHHDQVTLPLPTKGGPAHTLADVADALSDRLIALFVPSPGSDQPPAAGPRNDWPTGLLWFHEYFHGDTGAGLGATHQTGWTGLVADLVLRPRPLAHP